MAFVLLYLVVEIVALIALWSVIGLGWTLLVLVAGSILGLWLARREGLRAAQAIGDAMANRKVPTAEVTDGMLIAAGGVLLFVPGLVTDVAGLLLLLPPTRSLVRRRLVLAAERRVAGIEDGAHPLAGHGRGRRRRPPPRRHPGDRVAALLTRPGVAPRGGFARGVRAFGAGFPMVQRGYRGCANGPCRRRGPRRSPFLALSRTIPRIVDMRRSTTRHRLIADSTVSS